MPEPFVTNVDIANRALQHCGADRIVAFTDLSKNASAVAFVYDKVRTAELRRNVWRFATRKVVLRAVQTGLYPTTVTPLPSPTMVIVPGAYDPAKTYIVGSIVSYEGIFYQADAAVALAASPGAGDPWQQYFGPLTVSPWDTSPLQGNQGTTYFAGELVYTPVGANPGIYFSLQNGNTDTPTVTAAWDPTLPYQKGATVTYSAVVYQSTIDLNLNNVPTGTGDWITVPATQPDQMAGLNWIKLGSATLRSMSFVYPIGTGPVSDTVTRNIFMLPFGFLREAPEDPRQGSSSWMGAPSGGLYNDWDFEADFITSSDPGPITVRFVADIADVPEMDPLFCEGLGARIGLEICEELTQATTKIQTIANAYREFMTEARTVNGIETGPTEPPLDDFIACRI